VLFWKPEGGNGKQTGQCAGPSPCCAFLLPSPSLAACIAGCKRPRHIPISHVALSFAAAMGTPHQMTNQLVDAKPMLAPNGTQHPLRIPIHQPPLPSIRTHRCPLHTCPTFQDEHSSPLRFTLHGTGQLSDEPTREAMGKALLAEGIERELTGSKMPSPFLLAPRKACCGLGFHLGFHSKPRACLE